MADTSIGVVVFATLAGAWSWLGCYAGVVSFGHAVFFGIGAYAVAVSNLRGGSPWYGALGGALFAVLVSAICGLLVLRGRGYLFSAVTLVAGVLAEPFVSAHRWLGAGNVFIFPIRSGFFNLQFNQKWPYLMLALMVFAVMQALTYALRASRIGYSLRAVRSNPAAARSVGVEGRPLRLLALVGSAFVTSVAGSFFAEYRLGVSPPAMFSLALSLDIALVGIIAGTGSPWGAPLAGLIYALLATFVPLHPPGIAGSVILVAEGVAVAAIALGRTPAVFGTWVRRSGRAAAGAA